MKFVEVIASALILLLLLHALSTPFFELARLKKASREVRARLYELKESLMLAQNSEGGSYEEKAFSGKR